MTTTITRHPITLPSGFTFYMVEVPGGSFLMGDDDENAYGDEKIFHEVQIPDFWMAEYLTTQQLWLEVMDWEYPSYFQGLQRPIEKVSWYDAVAFCNELSTQYKLGARYFLDKQFRHPLSIKQPRSVQGITIFVDPQSSGFRLPVDAEWEYAARSSAKFNQNLKYAGSNNLDEVGWYTENSHHQTQPVGLKMSNYLGVYDMSGNVWEWCEDLSHTIYSAPVDEPAWVEEFHVIRGGQFSSYAPDCRSFSRILHKTMDPYGAVGFRVVCSPQSTDLFSR